MHVEIARLWPDFLRATRAQEPLVLAMIVRTSGSTYQKAGAMMLIDADGRPHGLLSGGCLEDDIAAHARSVSAEGRSKLVHYDLSDDSPFGLGLGCRGEVDVLMSALTPDQGYEPLSTLHRADQDDGTVGLSIHIDASDATTIGMATVVDSAKQWMSADGSVSYAQDPERLRVRFDRRPHLLVVGAGLDAGPLHAAASTLAWRCHGYDHRPGQLTDRRFPTATSLTCGSPQDIGDRLDLGKFDAAVLMSHNIDNDAIYLRALAPHRLGYIGLLGPGSRRNEALEKADLTLDDFRGALHGPAGLDIGGRQPESIALSVVAQIHAHLRDVGRLR